MVLNGVHELPIFNFFVFLLITKRLTLTLLSFLTTSQQVHFTLLIASRFKFTKCLCVWRKCFRSDTSMTSRWPSPFERCIAASTVVVRLSRLRQFSSLARRCPSCPWCTVKNKILFELGFPPFSGYTFFSKIICFLPVNDVRYSQLVQTCMQASFIPEHVTGSLGSFPVPLPTTS